MRLRLKGRFEVAPVVGTGLGGHLQIMLLLLALAFRCVESVGQCAIGQAVPDRLLHDRSEISCLRDVQLEGRRFG